MFMLRLFIVILSCFASLAQASGMAETAGFYQGSSPISGRDKPARELATKAALAQVLTRMSGNVSVSVSDEAQALIAQAARFVRSYRFAQEEIPAETGAAPRTRQMLVVDFDGSALNRAARQQGLPLWDARRPVTAVWLLGPTENGPRQLYERARVQQRLPGLLEAAQRRGLPMQYPLMDEQDQALVNVYDVIGEDYLRLETASTRYQARHILLLRIEQRDGLWYALWSFVQPDAEPIRWRSLGEEPNVALSLGFDRYADEMAARYARRFAAGWVQDTRLRVSGIADLASYARTLSYLENHHLVQQVSPNELDNQQVVFKLRFEGELDDLQRSLEQSGFLQEVFPEPVFDFNAPPDAAQTPPPTADGFQSQSGFQQNDALLAPTPTPTPASASGLNFYAIAADPELHYRYSQ